MLQVLDLFLLPFSLFSVLPQFSVEEGWLLVPLFERDFGLLPLHRPAEGGVFPGLRVLFRVFLEVALSVGVPLGQAGLPTYVQLRLD